MKKALILGASTYQLPLILKAKERGFYTLVVSKTGNYPGFRLADRSVHIDTTDVQQVVQLARDEDVDCVCTTGTDTAIRALGAVCDALDLPGISEAAGVLATNKREMKRRFESEGVCTARFREVASLDELQTAFNLFAKPVICKAVDTSGSRGIIRVDSAAELPHAYEYVMRATRQGYFLVEEFISGVEFGAQAAVINGDVQFMMPHGDRLYHGKTDVPIGHYVPYSMSGNIAELVRVQLEKAVKALGLTTCAINADFILRDDQVYVLEIGARAGATCLPELVSTYYGIDYYGYILDLSLGFKPQVYFVPKQPCGNLLICSSRNGLLDRFEVNPGSLDIVEVVFDYQRGDKLPVFKLGPDRLGHVIIRCADEASILRDLETLDKSIKVILQ